MQTIPSSYEKNVLWLIDRCSAQIAQTYLALHGKRFVNIMRNSIRYVQMDSHFNIVDSIVRDKLLEFVGIFGIKLIDL